MKLNLPPKNSIQVLVINAEEKTTPELVANIGVNNHTFNLELVQVDKLETLKRKARVFKTDVIVYHGNLTEPAHLDYLFDLLRSDLSLPIIAVTQRGSHAIASEVIEAGADDYFERDTSPHLAIHLPFSIKKAVRQSKLEIQCHNSFETADKAQKTKDDFMAVMSHEVRTPMNSIIGFTDLLLDSPEDDSQRDYLEIIKGNAYNLLEIMNNVLTYSRLDSATIQLDQRETDIAVLLEEVRETFAEETKRKGLTFNINIDPELPTEIISDYSELRQVILNLASNAVKFTSKGKVDIELSGYCNLENHNKTQWTYICTVKDTGIGIEQNEQKNIFELFKQIDSTSTRKFGGTGLGLAICKKIAEILKGEIWLESEPGKGSTFHFSFQASLTHVEKNALLNDLLINRNQFAKTYPLRILLGQTDSKDRRLLESVLKQMGYEYTVIETGLDVLNTINQDAFDIALIDIAIPKLNGLETTQLIRQGQGGVHNRGLFICALAGLQQQDSETRYQKAGFDAFLSKPIISKQLQPILMKASQTAADKRMRKAV